MSRTEDCRHIRDLIPAYALGALDEREAERVSRHLESCADCAEASVEYRQVAEGLLHAPPPHPAPAYLREQLLSELPGSSVEAATEKRGRIRLGRWAAVAAAAALLVANLVLLFELRALRTEQAQLQAQVDRNQMALAVQSYPSSQVVEVDGENVFGTFIYDPGRTVAVLYAWGLQPLPEGHVYQAWFTGADGERASAGLFGAQDEDSFTIAVLWAPSSLSVYDRLGVTVEPTGGSQLPSGPPVLSADF